MFCGYAAPHSPSARREAELHLQSALRAHDGTVEDESGSKYSGTGPALAVLARVMIESGTCFEIASVD